MVKLTEEMISLRAKTLNMNHVKKLNIWGCNLTDVSIVSQLANIEILGLSLNNITTLYPLRNLQKLETLFLRSNHIENVEELEHLKTLPRLRELLISENPFCDKLGPQYRATVLSILPNLESLDDRVVVPEELCTSINVNINLSANGRDTENGLEQEDWHENYASAVAQNYVCGNFEENPRNDEPYEVEMQHYFVNSTYSNLLPAISRLVRDLDLESLNFVEKLVKRRRNMILKNCSS